MSQTISSGERQILRKLAFHQQELAGLPEMQGRAELWTAHNDLRGEKPLVTIEMRTFAQDILPKGQCKTALGKILEHKLLSVITGYEATLDDRIVSNFYSVVPEVELEMFSIPLKRRRPKSDMGQSVSFSIEPTITDIERQLDTLKASTYHFDREAFLLECAAAQDVFGDILPLRVQCPGLGFFLSKNLSELMGMEAMMYAFYDYPVEMHSLLGKITDEYMAYFNYLEEEGFLVSNNENALVKMGTIGYTRDLPRRAPPQAAMSQNGCVVKTKEIWGHLNSQETSSVSPEMFKEFFLAEYAKAAERFGLYTYGCCEPVDNVWTDCIETLPPGMRKVSVSPWCDEAFMGERLCGGHIIYHRKPSPNFIGVGTHLDENAFAAHIKNTLLAARGCKVEFSMRDIYSLCGNLEKPKRAVAITRAQIERYWKP